MVSFFAGNRIVASLTSDVCLLLAEVGMGAFFRLPNGKGLALAHWLVGLILIPLLGRALYLSEIRGGCVPGGL